MTAGRFASTARSRVVWGGLAWASAGVLALACACASDPPDAPPQASPPQEQQRTFAQLIYVPGVDHVARISDRLYRGGQPEGVEGYRALKEAGIRTVINLRQFHDSRGDVEAAGLEYVSLSVQASLLGSEPPSEGQTAASSRSSWIRSRGLSSSTA